MLFSMEVLCVSKRNKRKKKTGNDKSSNVKKNLFGGLTRKKTQIDVDNTYTGS